MSCEKLQRALCKKLAFKPCIKKEEKTMLSTEITTSLREVLSIEDSHERNHKFIVALIKLDNEKELENTRAFIQSLPDELRAWVTYEDDINFEILLRNKWILQLESVDSVLLGYPSVEKRVKGIGYKVALLQFAEFCSCDVDVVCALLQEIISSFELGTKKVRKNCEIPLNGQWPRNHKSSVLRATAYFTENPCWILRELYLPEVVDSGVYNYEFSGIVEFCVVPRETPDEVQQPSLGSRHATLGFGRFW